MINDAIKGMTNLTNLEVITAKTEGINILQQNLHSAKMTIAHLEEKNKGLKEEIEEFRALMRKPMLEIANNDRFFKANYDAQMLLMADWMVSQKAFKELAIQFGFEKGLKPDEVMKIGSEKKIDVLECRNNPTHGTNSDTSEIISKRKEALIEKFKKDQEN